MLTTATGGEILVVTADAEVTNDLGFEVNFASHVVLADSCTSLSGTEIAEAQGGNITRTTITAPPPGPGC